MGMFSNLSKIDIELDDFEEIKKRIFSELGFPRVNVEITDDQLKIMIKRNFYFFEKENLMYVLALLLFSIF